MRGKRGQVMVLGCLMMLVLSLSLMMSFSVANAVHERIRIQSHADAMAFSMAVVEARTMNYIAYSNRALAATFVSMTTVHAYGVIASSSVTLMRAVHRAILIGIPFHLAVCVASFGSAPCCEHTAILTARAIQYLSVIRDYEDKVRGLEAAFNSTVKNFALMADVIHASQQTMVGATGTIISSGTARGFDKMGQENAPCASQGIPGGVGVLNMRNFACAMEGSVLDALAINCASRSELKERRRIMSNVVNASRPKFLSSSQNTPPFIGLQSVAFGPLIFNQTQFMPDLLQDIPAPEVLLMGFNYQLNAWLTDDACQNAKNDSRGDSSCARAGAGTTFIYVPFSSCFIPGIFAAFNAVIASNKDGNDHEPGSAHEGQHQEYKGLFANDSQGVSCLMSGNCFINHRLDKKEKNWGQPAVYTYITQSLRDETTSDNNCNQHRHAWEINDQKTVTVNHGKRPQGRLRLVPGRDGVAISKAMVYFHRVDDWRFPPNLFDPYWRAKLHPFDGETERLKVLGAGGYSF